MSKTIKTPNPIKTAIHVKDADAAKTRTAQEIDITRCSHLDIFTLASQAYGMNHRQDIAKSIKMMGKNKDESVKSLAWALGASMHHPDVREAVSHIVKNAHQRIYTVPLGDLNNPSLLVMEESLVCVEGYIPQVMAVIQVLSPCQDEEGNPIMNVSCVEYHKPLTDASSNASSAMRERMIDPYIQSSYARDIHMLLVEE